MVKEMAGYFGALVAHALALPHAPAAAGGAPGSPASTLAPGRSPGGGGAVSPAPSTATSAAGAGSPGSPGVGAPAALWSLPSLPPLTRVNAITVAVYAPRIAAHLHSCASTARGAGVPPDALASVVEAVERGCAGMLEMVLEAWLNGMLFHFRGLLE